MATPAWMFPEVPKADLDQSMLGSLDRNGEFEFVYSSLIVRSGARVALLDTGFSNAGESFPEPLRHALSELGITRSDVDNVVISHGHPDHIGGLTRSHGGDTRLSFPEATHHLHEDEFRFWTDAADETPNEADQKFRFLKQHARLETISQEHEILPGVRAIPAPGHTPGHMAVALSSNREHALYVGDALAHEINVSRPEWNHFSDMLPSLSVQSRRTLVERAAENAELIIASHIPFLGKVKTSGPEGHRHFERYEPGTRPIRAPHPA